MEGRPAWGIEPVPSRLRVLGLLDQGLLWGNLGVSLLVLVAGTYLVPALSLPEAFLAIVLGGLIGNAMLGAAGMIGADARVPAMVLMRAPLGQRGSWAPTVLNAAQCVGWAIFELLIIATAVAALSDELFGFRASGSGRSSSAASRWRSRCSARSGSCASSCASSPSGPCSRRSLYLTWWALDGAGFGSLWERDGRGRLLRARRRRPRRRDHRLLDPARRRLHALRPRPRERVLGHGGAATSSPARGSGCSARSSSSRATSPIRRRCPVAVAAGGLGAVLALLAVTVDETDEAFANAYSAAVSIQNLAPEVPQRALVVAVSVVRPSAR